MLYAGVKRFGAITTLMFFFGSIIWATAIENIGVLAESYTYYGFADLFIPGYPGFLLWVGFVPFWIQLGWFTIPFSSFIIFHDIILPKQRVLIQAEAAGLYAVNIDALIDPVSASNKLWQWIGINYYVLGIPLYNFFGWFFLVFFYDLIFLHTIILDKQMKGITSIENLVFKKKSNGSVSAKMSRFAFRLILLNLLVATILTMISSLFAMFPNGP